MYQIKPFAHVKAKNTINVTLSYLISYQFNLMAYLISKANKCGSKFKAFRITASIFAP